MDVSSYVDKHQQTYRWILKIATRLWTFWYLESNFLFCYLYKARMLSPVEIMAIFSSLYCYSVDYIMIKNNFLCYCIKKIAIS